MDDYRRGICFFPAFVYAVREVPADYFDLGNGGRRRDARRRTHRRERRARCAGRQGDPMRQMILLSAFIFWAASPLTAQAADGMPGMPGMEMPMPVPAATIPGPTGPVPTVIVA